MEVGHAYQRFVKQYFTITPTIAVSNPIEGVNHISAAYQQALPWRKSLQRQAS
jgi:hypothetical protein